MPTVCSDLGDRLDYGCPVTRTLEYACHERNHRRCNILSAARAEERTAERKYSRLAGVEVIEGDRRARIRRFQRKRRCQQHQHRRILV
jgi:hypothetical protein